MNHESLTLPTGYLSAAEAMKYLAEKWDNPTTDKYLDVSAILIGGMSCTGICFALKQMKSYGLISLEIYYFLGDFISSHRPKDKLRNTFWWPRDKEGAIERAKFCRNMVTLLENPI